MNKHDLFISYAKENKAIADEISIALENQGINVWKDTNSIKWGDSFPKQIIDAIANSQYFLVLISNNWFQSNWCEKELSSAFNYSLKRRENNLLSILPLLLSEEVYSRYKEIKLLDDIQYRIYSNDPDDVALTIIEKGTINLKSKKSGWSKTKSDTLNAERYLNIKSNNLDHDRKAEIVKLLITSLPKLRNHRNEHLIALKQLRNSSQEFGAKSLPAWVRVNRTDSKAGFRLIIGLRNKTCAYRDFERLGLGCLNCGYYAGTGKNIDASPENLMQQLHEGFKIGYKIEKAFDVIEFLCDGSFLNDHEFPDTTKTYIFNIIRKIPYIKRVLVESRPEHVYSQKDELSERLLSLRQDQELEIGIGLETTDDFIRESCINKGFELSAFIRAVKKVSEVNLKFNNRCNIVAYVLVKPAFLTTEETILDVISTLRDLSRISKEYNVKIIPKLEPAAISDGTILSLLHHEGKYDPLNYWVILEIIVRAALDEECKPVNKFIRIGAREDMDDILKVPAIYNSDGRFDQFDFILYDAIQQYNQHHNLLILFAIIDKTYQKGSFGKIIGLNGLINANSSFTSWINSLKNYKNSFIVGYIKKYKNEISIEAQDSYLSEESNILSKIYAVLDELEGYHRDRSTIKEIAQVIINSTEYPFTSEVKNTIGSIITNKFPTDELINVKIIELKKEPNYFLRIFFEVQDYISTRKFIIWSEVPYLKYIRKPLLPTKNIVHMADSAKNEDDRNHDK